MNGMRTAAGAAALAAACFGEVCADELTPREIYDRVSPAVVMVVGHGEGGRRGNGGTGSLVQADGLVLTNAHVVVEEATGKPFPRLSVYLRPPRVTGDPKVDLSRKFRATVVAHSTPLDLALLRLDGVTEPLPVLEFGVSEDVRIGDRVVAIGHPEQGGLWALTTGVISAELENFNGVAGKHVFQTETGLNRGNSGGPLLNSEGRMVGVNTAIARVAPDGLAITSISFSVKSSVAGWWLGKQGVPAAQAGHPMVASPRAAPGEPAAARRPVKPGRANTYVPFKSHPAETTSSPKPYDLDELVAERTKAEEDLERMITDMRGRFKSR